MNRTLSAVLATVLLLTMTVACRPASTVPFEQVSGRIRELLTEHKKQERSDAFVAGLRKKARIEVLV